MKLINKFFFLTLFVFLFQTFGSYAQQPIVTIFAPGIFSNERQIVKYCKEYISSTGNHFYCDNDFLVIKPPYYSINFSEVIVNEADCNQKSTFFSHVYNYITNKIWHIRSKSNDQKEHIIAHDTSDVQWINVGAINFGQDKDITTFSQVYDRVVAQYPDHEILVYGVSRGAATIMTFLGTEYLRKKIKNIKAAVCEGCYDSLENIINNFSVPGLARFIINSVFTGYDPKGISPLSIVTQIPKNIPILFITSEKDSLVPVARTEQLFKALQDEGHEKTYLVKLKYSAHPRYMIDHEEDKKTYLQAVHTFYKNYNLPYDSKWAEIYSDYLQFNF